MVSFSGRFGLNDRISWITAVEWVYYLLFQWHFFIDCWCNCLSDSINKLWLQWKLTKQVVQSFKSFLVCMDIWLFLLIWSQNSYPKQHVNSFADRMRTSEVASTIVNLKYEGKRCTKLLHIHSCEALTHIAFPLPITCCEVRTHKG